MEMCKLSLKRVGKDRKWKKQRMNMSGNVIENYNSNYGKGE